MTGKDKIQHLLITYLMNYGSISLRLPDEVELQIGITQEGKNGLPIKSENYCWVVTSRGDKSVALDSYNLGLNFSSEKDIIMFEDKDEDRVCVNVVM
jgi:hypothetical protein